VTGSPDPEVTWYRDGVPLSETPNLRFGVMENKSLHISFMRREDSGMFQCIAGNEAGDVTASTWLRVKSKSGKNLTITFFLSLKAQLHARFFFFLDTAICIDFTNGDKVSWKYELTYELGTRGFLFSSSSSCNREIYTLLWHVSTLA
jgi:hypothetical protein